MVGHVVFIGISSRTDEVLLIGEDFTGNVID